MPADQERVRQEAERLLQRLEISSHGIAVDAHRIVSDLLAQVASLQATVERYKKLGEGVRVEHERLQAIAAELSLPQPTDRQGYTGPFTAFDIIAALRQSLADLHREIAQVVQEMRAYPRIEAEFHSGDREPGSLLAEAVARVVVDRWADRLARLQPPKEQA